MRGDSHRVLYISLEVVGGGCSRWVWPQPSFSLTSHPMFDQLGDREIDMIPWFLLSAWGGEDDPLLESGREEGEAHAFCARVRQDTIKG
jgi:hypothetical protein